MFYEDVLKELENTPHQAIQGYIKFLSDKKLSETYIDSLIKCFRAYFKYCYEERYILKNPMDKIKFQKEPLTLINTFNDKEVREMVRFYNGRRFLDIRNRFMMILLFDTGMRNVELCQLKLSDIIKGLLEQEYGQAEMMKECSVMFLIERNLDRMWEKSRKISEGADSGIMAMKKQ